MTPTEKRAALAQALRSGEFIIAPGVFDMVSARLADRLEFRALYLSGYGVSAAHLGLPDAGLASYADILERVRTVAGGTSTPLICDADTGFGGLLNVQHTVRGFEQAGCAAVQIEDQAVPKKCGFTPGRRMIPSTAMQNKIRVALEARRDPNLLIIARTDARTSLGIEEALYRGQAYAEAGADVIFIQAPESVDELAKIGQTINKPLLANMGLGGTTPPLSAAELQALGFALAIYPNPGLLAAAAALQSVYATLRRGAPTTDLEAPSFAPDAMHRLMGFEDIWAFEEKWSAAEDAS